jgi:hypothetical protein
MRHSLSKIVLVSAVALGVILPCCGCLSLSEKQEAVWDRLFPENPNDVFLDDAARDIDRRLSNSSAQMGL